MGHSHIEVWVHYVWSTKDRAPWLQNEIRANILEHIRGYSQDQKIVVDTINATDDHVHCLTSLRARMTVCDLVGQLKGESSHWVNFERLTREAFIWQDGYAAYSVSPSQLERVRQYIRDQELHHQGRDFTEEMELLVAEDWGALTGEALGNIKKRF